MKHRAFTLLGIIPFLLCSCGKDAYLGSYTFQMGKNSDTHMMINMVLKDIGVKNDAGELLGKGFTITGEATFSDASSEESQSPIFDLLKDGLTLNGYYNIGDPLKDGSNILSIGFALDDIESETGIAFPISSETVEKFVYSEISKKSINIHAPVSIDDLMLQLYWYGLDFYYDGDEQKTRDVESHPAGTHPTEADIAAINETYPADHKDAKYRDFHTLTLPLLKD